MTSANTSGFQETPWEPTVYLTGNKDSNQVQQNAAAQYTKIYGGSPTVTHGSPPSAGTNDAAPVPSLAAAYTQAPDFVPNAPPMSGGGNGGNTPSSDVPFFIDLAALRAAEQQCLNATQNAIAGYETLTSTVSSAMASTTIFGQEVDNDQLDPDAKQFAKSIGPGMTTVLHFVGSVIEGMGQFNALLNNTGQMYTYTDSNCAFPSDLAP
jgi:hypothetical protein